MRARGRGAMIRRAAGSMRRLQETAWLEAMAELIRQGRLGELDFPHLGEYLADMARRDRREVESRLTVLISHLLKGSSQPDRRSRGWRGTIIAQRQELERALGRGVRRNPAEAGPGGRVRGGGG